MKILNLFAIILVLSACKSSKNTDYVIIATEAKRLQSALREAKVGEGKKAEEYIKRITYDGTIRWILSEDSNFLFRSVNKHSINATSSEKSYIYISKSGDIVQK